MTNKELKDNQLPEDYLNTNELIEELKEKWIMKYKMWDEEIDRYRFVFTKDNKAERIWWYIWITLILVIIIGVIISCFV